MNTVIRSFLRMICGLLLCSILSNALADDGRAHLRGPSLAGSVKVKSWKALRDERVVKQDLDYSCGAASLATVLNEYYGQPITDGSFTESDAGGYGY